MVEADLEMITRLHHSQEVLAKKKIIWLLVDEQKWQLQTRLRGSFPYVSVGAAADSHVS